MSLNRKILMGVCAVVVLVTVGALATVYTLSAQNRVDAVAERMASVLQQAEIMQVNMDRMYQAGAFDTDHLLEQASRQVGGRPLTEAYTATDLYHTVPVVASWEAVQETADNMGYTFEISAAPGRKARNPEHDLAASYIDAFAAVEAGAEHHLERRGDELIMAFPVTLKPSCMACHGDPAQSASGDGRDLLGFPMEGMRTGELVGLFVLRTPMSNDPVVASTMAKMLMVSLLIGVAVLAGFWFFNRRAIEVPLLKAIDVLSSASRSARGTSDELSGSASSLADGANQQAAALQETSASLEEIAAQTAANAEHARSANELAAATREAADGGKEAVGRMNEAMNGIQEASSSISAIIQTIDEIAFQTNLLALNAAVEAARAGEAGKGFAVVAEEVRNLAQRSAEAAKDTEGRIQQSVERGREGAEISARVTQDLETINERTLKVTEVMESIARASGEQSEGLNQLTSAVTVMDQVTQGNARAADESARGAHTLNDQALLVSSAVEDLAVMVRGR